MTLQPNLCELELLKLAKGGDREAVETLYCQYKYLLKSKCRGVKCQQKDMGRDDMEQTAAIAFLAAIQRFDPRRNKKFISYMIQAVLNELHKQSREATTIRVPHVSRWNAKHRISKRASTTVKLRQSIERALATRSDTKLVSSVTTTDNPTFDEVVLREEWQIVCGLNS